MKPVRIDSIKNQSRFRFTHPIEGIIDVPYAKEWRKIRHEITGTTIEPVGSGPADWRVVPNSTKVQPVITDTTPVNLPNEPDLADAMARVMVRQAMVGNPIAKALLRTIFTKE